MPSSLPVIPQNITVHLGRPDANVANVTVPFPDYIKNVASSEIYPTWPESALRANIYAQISFALNRVYTEWYPSRGYSFDITNSTQYDQAYTPGRDVFENISQIVDDIFNNYVKRYGTVEPYFTQFCNGTTVTCDGLSQWGTVELANQGMTPYEILQYYYGDDIEIVRNAPIQNIQESYPGIPLRLGSVGNDVQAIQIRLNRISQNYPLIPKINPVNGVFDENTENAVRQFQQIFNLAQDGIVGKSTWYKLQFIYVNVKRLAELESEGISLQEISKQFETSLQEGMSGESVRVLQYYLAVLNLSNPEIPPVEVDGIFGPTTKNAVIAFQRINGLTQDGIVGRNTWNLLYNDYLGYVRSLPNTDPRIAPYIFPGDTLTLGSRGPYVEYLQTYLTYISQFYPIPPVPVTGYFGTQTQASVRAFQQEFGLNPTGNVGPTTWNRIASLYSDLLSAETAQVGQYPGYTLQEGS